MTRSRRDGGGDAGRRLFAPSRLDRISVNDVDRLKEYQARFDLKWDTLR
ncbi:MAG: hypothetical protein ACK4MF_00505 [Hyphomicrobiaceae bacterium]